jgi:hypothetical protein
VRTERRRGPSRGRGRRVGPSAAAAWSATPHAGGSARTPGHRAGAVPGCTCRPHGCVERSHRSSPVAARPHVGSLRNAGLTGLEVDVTAPHGVPAAGVRATFSDVREPYTPPPWRQTLPPRASELVRRTQLPAVSGPNWRDSATDRAPVLSTARSEAREWSAPPHGDAFRETAREPLFSSGSWAATGSRRPPGQVGSHPNPVRPVLNGWVRSDATGTTPRCPTDAGTAHFGPGAARRTRARSPRRHDHAPHRLCVIFARPGRLTSPCAAVLVRDATPNGRQDRVAEPSATYSEPGINMAKGSGGSKSGSGSSGGGKGGSGSGGGKSGGNQGGGSSKGGSQTGGGWPSTTGNPSGGGRTNGPPSK